MSSYILASDEEVKIIDSYSFNESYTFEKFNKKSKIRKLTIYDENFINNIVSNNFLSNFQRIVQIIESLFADENDSSESDFIIALDEVQKLKEMLIHEYQSYLKKEAYKDFLDRLSYFEEVINKKIVELDKIKESNRGR